MWRRNKPENKLWNQITRKLDFLFLIIYIIGIIISK